MTQLCAGLQIGILDLHRNGLCIEGGLAVLHDLDGNRAEAFGNTGDGAEFVHLYNRFIAGLKFHSCILGEVGIQGVAQHNGLRGVHGEVVLTLEEPLIATFADILVLCVDDIVGLGGGVAV